MRSVQYRLGLWWIAASVLGACIRQNATAVELPISGDAGPSEDAASPPPRDVPRAGTTAAASGRGGSSGNPFGEGGRSGASGSTAGVGGVDAGRPVVSPEAGPPPLADYTLVVDAPGSGDTLAGTVTIRGRAAKFKNVEVWDATHKMPPLAQTTPKADSTFSMTIDVSKLLPGTTTWTVYAWDSPPGDAYENTANVRLNLTIAAGEDGAPDPGTAYVPPGYTLKFSDEFNAASLDTEKWNTLSPFGKQFYTDSQQKHAFIPEGVSLSEGILTFTARKSDGSNTAGQPYSSGSITSNGTFTHGYFEARIKVPAGKGLWPAFWLTATKWPPEWDIAEIINNQIIGTRHPREGGKCTFVGGAAGPDERYEIAHLYGVFHVYGFRWTETALFSYVDGVLTSQHEIDAAAGSNEAFWLNLSLQIGGNKPKLEPNMPGDPDDTTPFPARMEVDYIRVYEE